MITVDFILRQYCQEKNLPEPTKQDLEHCGRMIGYHFKNYWAVNHPNGYIHDAGFVKISSPENMVVNAYPDEFEPEMISRIDAYFAKKQPPVTDEIPPKKVRKRIPVKPQLTYSTYTPSKNDKK